MEIFISSAVTLVICIINNIFQSRQTRDLIEYRLTKLEEKVDKHNNVIERTYKLEERCSVIEAEMEKT